MKLHGTMKINQAGHLEIGGCAATELVKQYGSPLYVMDEALIRQNCRSYVQSFRAAYSNSEVIYASKVFSTQAICRLIQEEDMGLDVVSAPTLDIDYIQSGKGAKFICDVTVKPEVELGRQTSAQPCR